MCQLDMDLVFTIFWRLLFLFFVLCKLLLIVNIRCVKLKNIKYKNVKLFPDDILFKSEACCRLSLWHVFTFWKVKFLDEPVFGWHTQVPCHMMEVI